MQYFLWKHNVLRYLAPFDHEKPSYYYLPDLLLGMLPWSLLLIPLARFLGRHSVAASARRPAALGFFLISSLWCLVFYSLAGSKRAGYILPAMPPLTLALGCYLDILLTQSGRVWSAAVPFANSFAFRTTLAVLGVASASTMLAHSAELLSSTSAMGLAAAGIAAFMVVYRFGHTWKPAAAWGGCGVATFAVLFLSVHLALPRYARKFSMREQVQPYAKLCQDLQVPVVCYPRCWDSVSFYLGREDVRVYTPDRRPQLIADLRANPRTLAFIKSDHSLDELLRDLPGSMEFVPDGEPGNVAVGWVRPRLEAPATLFAGRE